MLGNQLRAEVILLALLIQDITCGHGGRNASGELGLNDKDSRYYPTLVTNPIDMDWKSITHA